MYLFLMSFERRMRARSIRLLIYIYLCIYFSSLFPRVFVIRFPQPDWLSLAEDTHNHERKTFFYRYVNCILYAVIISTSPRPTNILAK